MIRIAVACTLAVLLTGCSKVPDCAAPESLKLVKQILSGSIVEQSLGLLTVGDVESKLVIKNIQTVSMNGPPYSCKADVAISNAAEIEGAYLSMLQGDPPADLASSPGRFAVYVALRQGALTAMGGLMGAAQIGAGGVEALRNKLRSAIKEVVELEPEVQYAIAGVEKGQGGNNFKVTAQADILLLPFLLAVPKVSTVIAPVAGPVSAPTPQPQSTPTQVASVESSQGAVSPAGVGAQDAGPTSVAAATTSIATDAKQVPSEASSLAKVNPSFDCSKATTRSERSICGSERLSAADAEMARVYESAISETGDKDALRTAQRAWRRERDRCNDDKCLMNAYQTRMAELATSK